MERRILAQVGGKSLTIQDKVTNFGYRPSPFTILYHINFGFPLLTATSRALVSASESTPFNDLAASDVDHMLQFSDPVRGYEEHNYSHRMACDDAGRAYAALINPELCGGLGVYIRFDGKALPYLNEWKMMGEGDYVAALEPCNAPCENRASLRAKNLLPFLAPGETRKIEVEIGVLEGAQELAACEARLAAIAGSAH